MLRRIAAAAVATLLLCVAGALFAGPAAAHGRPWGHGGDHYAGRFEHHSPTLFQSYGREHSDHHWTDGHSPGHGYSHRHDGGDQDGHRYGHGCGHGDSHRHAYDHGRDHGSGQPYGHRVEHVPGRTDHHFGRTRHHDGRSSGHRHSSSHRHITAQHSYPHLRHRGEDLINRLRHIARQRLHHIVLTARQVKPPAAPAVHHTTSQHAHPTPGQSHPSKPTKPAKQGTHHVATARPPAHKTVQPPSASVDTHDVTADSGEDPAAAASGAQHATDAAQEDDAQAQAAAKAATEAPAKADAQAAAHTSAESHAAAQTARHRDP